MLGTLYFYYLMTLRHLVRSESRTNTITSKSMSTDMICSSARVMYASFCVKSSLACSICHITKVFKSYPPTYVIVNRMSS